MQDYFSVRVAPQSDQYHPVLIKQTLGLFFVSDIMICNIKVNKCSTVLCHVQKSDSLKVNALN